MEEWTDIIGKELEGFEVHLPADDWSVLQQKHAASRKRKRTAALAWACIASIAAATALLLIPATTHNSPGIHDNLPVISDNSNDLSGNSSVNPDRIRDLTDMTETIIYQSPVIPSRNTVTHDTASDHTVVIDVISDPIGDLPENLIADASVSVPESSDSFYGFPDDAPMSKKKLRISFGISGAFSDDPEMGIKDMLPSFGDNDATSSPTVPTDKPIEVPPPTDSTEVKSFGSYGVMTRSESGYTDYYDHYLPVSFGLSARIFLSDRFSVNTGINYTRYSSTRNRVYHSSNRTQKEMQSVHYLGIPIRLDLIAVSKKNFTLYVGGGCQMDKCVYAKVGEERLHENQILFGVNGTIGIQVNFSPVIGLYFEPEISYALNEGTIPIFRSTHSQSFTLRAGLRVNL